MSRAESSFAASRRFACLALSLAFPLLLLPRVGVVNPQLGLTDASRPEDDRKRAWEQPASQKFVELWESGRLAVCRHGSQNTGLETAEDTSRQ